MMINDFQRSIIAAIYATELRACREHGDSVDDKKRIALLQYAESEEADLDIALTFAKREQL